MSTNEAPDTHPVNVFAGLRLGVLTSGGDAQGMNAAVRAVVRVALGLGARPYAIQEGWAGAVKGGDSIRELSWSDTSGILREGGTVIGTARCPEFREYWGRHVAVKNMLEHKIDRLIVIGGDGSLSGADEFREEWSQHVRELLEEGEISAEVAEAHSNLMILGLVGSIDNDLVGSDMTIGADTALHRIVDAIDQISSTAASHQRSFIVEVMGRHCGYLPLMSAVAGGADYVFLPESPVGPGWEDDMAEKLRVGREAGRRESMILVAEGATDQDGNPVTSQQVADVLRERSGEDARITILGHVQRGGSPSAYDRWMSTLLGYAAAQEVLSAQPGDEAPIIGVRNNRLTKIPMMQAIKNTRAVKTLVAEKRYEDAQRARGTSFVTMLDINRQLSTPPQLDVAPVNTGMRVAMIHAGGLAPGMNTAARSAVRMGISRGWTMLGIENSWAGLIDGKVRDLAWSDVEGWAFEGGSVLGTRREIPAVEQYYAIGRAIEHHQIDALLVIGGVNAYLAVQEMHAERSRYPAFDIPMVLVPASIDNNLPGSELSIGADTALNNAMWALDRIKESAAASRRCFVAEIMGRRCGYLTLMAGFSAGAEFSYLAEKPYDLADLDVDAKQMRASFEQGRRLCLAVVNEEASDVYDRTFLAKVFEAEGKGLFDVRHAALGHLQQGGAPSPFDRLLATRLVHFAMDQLAEQIDAGKRRVLYVGQSGNALKAFRIEDIDEDFDMVTRRPVDQWWLDLEAVLPTVSLHEQDRVMPVIDVHVVDEAPKDDTSY